MTMLNLTVKDNGCGFKPQDLENSHCLGLVGMRERAALVGGSLELQSRPGKGTRINFRLPLANRKVVL